MIYKGNTKIRDEGSYGVYHGSDPIAAIYYGSDRVYMFNKSTTWQAGTTLAQYTVSPWCNKLRVDCVGSQGHNSYGGKGGRVQCVMTVTPNQVLYISVGAMDNDYNAADIRTNNSGLTNTTSLNSRLIVAGGGGRAGWNNGAGGAGGGMTGATGGTSWGDSYGGGGGTQFSGGAGGGHGNVFGENGAAGSFGLGAKRSGGGAGTGSGGAGWYGGGSGGAGWYVAGDAYRWGAGGGGSSYTNSTLCDNVTHTQGYQTGAGYITITEIE